MSTGADLRRVRAELAALPARALGEVAPVAVRGAEDVGRRVAPRGIGGRRLSARAQVSGGVLEVAATPAGPWRIANDGARAHRIAPARGRVLAGRLAHPVPEAVAHPGARGRRVWPAVEALAADAAAQALRVALDRVLAHA